MDCYGLIQCELLKNSANGFYLFFYNNCQEQDKILQLFSLFIDLANYLLNCMCAHRLSASIVISHLLKNNGNEIGLKYMMNFYQ
jgi:hypothetical protein